MRTALLITSLALSLLKAPAADLSSLTIDQLKNGIENQHPSAFYILAQKLFAAPE